jgi:hypothetical protein
VLYNFLLLGASQLDNFAPNFFYHYLYNFEKLNPAIDNYNVRIANSMFHIRMFLILVLEMELEPELAELDAKTIHDPPPLVRMRLNYPMPIVDHGEARERTLKAYKAAAVS